MTLPLRFSLGFRRHLFKSRHLGPRLPKRWKVPEQLRGTFDLTASWGRLGLTTPGMMKVTMKVMIRGGDANSDDGDGACQHVPAYS